MIGDLQGEYMDLYDICKELRCNIVNCIASIGSGHIGGSLSVAELLTVLYFKHMNVDPKNPKMQGRDRLIMSKGHAGCNAWLYRVFAYL